MRVAMDNVVPFRARKRQKTKQSYPVVTTVVDPNAKLHPGDTVAVCWFRDNGSQHEVTLSRYWGPTGRDAKGRFVKAGSPREEYALDHFSYCPGENENCRILGKVVISGWSHDVTVDKSV